MFLLLRFNYIFNLCIYTHNIDLVILLAMLCLLAELSIDKFFL